MSDVPHITVSVEFRGETVRQQGAFFIDAIDFLCQVEKAVRIGCNLAGVDTDGETRKICSENLKRLMSESQHKGE